MRSRRITSRSATVALAATVILAGSLTAPAAADDAFGQHVRTCAQDIGFDGGHNPGSHRGHAGWAPDHAC